LLASSLLSMIGCESGRESTPLPVASVTSRAAESTATPAMTAAPSHSGAAVLEKTCEGICEISHRLKCKNAGECTSSCIAMGSLEPCTAATAAFYRCLRGHPAEHWECSSEGIASVKDGYCDAEQARAAACLAKATQ
jgi:hypothetical protein